VKSDSAQLCQYWARYHEAVVANLLEVLLSHDACAQAASDDALFELADFSTRAVRPCVSQACQSTVELDLSHTAPLSSFSLPSQLLYLTTVKHSDRSADACVPHTTPPSKARLTTPPQQANTGSASRC